MQRLDKLARDDLSGYAEVAICQVFSPASSAAIPQAALRVLEGSGHIAHLEVPQCFLEAVGGFLAPQG